VAAVAAVVVAASSAGGAWSLPTDQSTLGAVQRPSVTRCTGWTYEGPLELRRVRSYHAKYGIRVILIDQRNCLLRVRSCLEYKGVGPDGTDFRAQMRGTPTVRECIPDREIGRLRHYRGELPLDHSSQYKFTWVKILNLREVGYYSRDGSDTVAGVCRTKQRFPVVYSKPGVYFIRYTCRV
jgi:hypothetical protein